MGWFDHFDSLVAQFGVERGRELADLASDTIAELGERTSELGIPCDYCQTGSLYVASTSRQSGAWASAARAAAAAGRRARFHELDADELCRRTATPVSVGVGAIAADTAIVHPGKLVRGLRRAVLHDGIDIFEYSPVLSFERARPPRITTPYGNVTAGHVVFAIGAWSTALRELRGAILPFASHVVATPPARELLRTIGLDRRIAAADAQLLVSYMQTTADGRVVFGRGSRPIATRVHPGHFGIVAESERVVNSLARWYPRLSALGVTHAWAGPVDVSPGYFPFAGSTADGTVTYACGYSGDGVAQSLLMSKIVASLALGQADRWSALPIAHGPRRRFPLPKVSASVGDSMSRLLGRDEDAEEAFGHTSVWGSAVRAVSTRWL